MPVYLFWGDDDFGIARAVRKLRDRVLDPAWSQFNFEKIPGDRPEATLEALNQVMTPPFGMGGRLVWLENATLCQQCPPETLVQLERILPAIAPESHLLLTSAKKPDKRLRSTKLIEEWGKVSEFSEISPWKTDEIVLHVQKIAQEMDLKLTPGAVSLLASSVGGQTRQLWSELEKLALFRGDDTRPVDRDTVELLVTSSTQNSLQLAEAIRQGHSDRALTLVGDLLARNEPALRIVATLVGQFRTWLWIKLQVEAGETDEKAIAAAAEVNNPKRIYFLRKEIQHCSSQQLLQALPVLQSLEWGLKRGADPTAHLSAKAIELCELFKKQNK